MIVRPVCPWATAAVAGPANGAVRMTVRRSKSGAAGDGAPFLSVVVPFFNEGGNIAPLFARLFPVLDAIPEAAAGGWEVVCVNDGSGDDTLARLLAAREADPRLVIVDLSRNFGKECALSAGLAQARGRVVVSMDADLQHPPETIPEMMAKWRGGTEMVYAVRHARVGQAQAHQAAARLFYFLMRHLSDVPLPPEAGDFRLMDRCVVDAINSLPERQRFMKGIFAWVGFRQDGVVYQQEARGAGTSKFRPLHLVRFAIDGLTAFSTFPLTVWTAVGATVSGLAFFYIVIRMILVVLTGIDVPGYESTIVIILFLGGVQLLSLGVLGSYLGRVFGEVKRRPLYVVRRVHGAPDTAARTEA